jgi:hypothetical protein
MSSRPELVQRNIALNLQASLSQSTPCLHSYHSSVTSCPPSRLLHSFPLLHHLRVSRNVIFEECLHEVIRVVVAVLHAHFQPDSRLLRSLHQVFTPQLSLLVKVVRCALIDEDGRERGSGSGFVLSDELRCVPLCPGCLIRAEKAAEGLDAQRTGGGMRDGSEGGDVGVSRRRRLQEGNERTATRGMKRKFETISACLCSFPRHVERTMRCWCGVCCTRVLPCCVLKWI